MARNNKPRTLGSEKTLAQRIKRERTARGWSPADLAREMTDVGCSMATSAIYRIEEDTRKISVDELVALTKIFDATMEELLTPIDLLDKRRATELIGKLDEAMAALNKATNDWIVGYAELVLLEDGNDTDQELHEYVINQTFGRRDEASLTDWAPAVIADDGRTIEIDRKALSAATIDFVESMFDIAVDVAHKINGKSHEGDKNGKR
ncbi:MAG: helix-turn-helix transcriptional regulator [Propionibacteriaceae bacterium]|nr:helix-turn-helix transcriptional regulator [Propionibacteriaceae bacterium]